MASPKRNESAACFASPLTAQEIPHIIVCLGQVVWPEHSEALTVLGRVAVAVVQGDPRVIDLKCRICAHIGKRGLDVSIAQRRQPRESIARH